MENLALDLSLEAGRAAFGRGTIEIEWLEAEAGSNSLDAFRCVDARWIYALCYIGNMSNSLDYSFLPPVFGNVTD